MMDHIICDDEKYAPMRKWLTLLQGNCLNENDLIAYKNYATFTKYIQSIKILFVYDNKNLMGYDQTPKNLVYYVNVGRKNQKFNFMSGFDLAREIIDLIISLEIAYIEQQIEWASPLTGFLNNNKLNIFICLR